MKRWRKNTRDLQQEIIPVVAQKIVMSSHIFIWSCFYSCLMWQTWLATTRY